MTRAAREVLVVGGGYAGLTAARKLSRWDEVRVTLVDPHAYMTYQPLLPETAAGSVNPAHVVVPLRSALPKVHVLSASLKGLDRERRVAEVSAADGRTLRVAYDDVVLALGSVTRVLPIPGLVENAIGFRTVEEALHLGNRVLSRLEIASTLFDPVARRRALTFVFVGGGYAGVEALAEIEDMVRRNARRYGVDHTETRWVLVEAAERILQQLPERLARYAATHLAGRGVEILTGTTLVGVGDGEVHLGDGRRIPSETVVWTAGVVANPVVASLGFETDRSGRVVTDAQLRVAGEDGVWAVGDCAAVPDVHTGGTCAPTAQHAVRQAVLLAANLVRTPRPGSAPSFVQSSGQASGQASGQSSGQSSVRPSRELRGYRHRDAGAVASLGLGKGVAELYGVPVRGYPAWLLHRVYHGTRLPCGRRRVQILLLWVLGFISRDPVALHALETPRRPMELAHRLQVAPSAERAAREPGESLG